LYSIYSGLSVKFVNCKFLTNESKLGITCIPICFEEGSCLIYIFLHLSTYIAVQYDFHIIWCSYCLTITQQVPLVEQELLTLPDHPTSSKQMGIHVMPNLLKFIWKSSSQEPLWLKWSFGACLLKSFDTFHQHNQIKETKNTAK
jgi:hypothetical protein